MTASIQALTGAARIIGVYANLSQTLDVFHTERGPTAAIDATCRRSGRWFDPELVDAAVCMSKNGTLWRGLENPDLSGEYNNSTVRVGTQAITMNYSFRF
jgi:hypothetical protein